MLRVGLTGGLGSGKSTVAAMLREHGAHVIEADATGRELMQPGQPVYREILEHFGQAMVKADGSLDRRRLAEMAFQHGRIRELSLIVHPAVIAAQEQWMREVARRDKDAVAVVESALIFEAERDGTAPGWRERFDRILLVVAPHALKVARYVDRTSAIEEGRAAALAADAEARIATQIPDEVKIPLSDIVIHNSTSLEDTRQAVRHAWNQLQAAAQHRQESAANQENRP